MASLAGYALSAGAWVLGKAFKGAGYAGIGITGAGLKAGYEVGKVGLNVAGKVGNAAIGAAEGAGTVLTKTLGSASHREGLARSYGALLGGIGEKFMKTDAQGRLRMTKFGFAAVAGAGMFDNSRDLYTKEKARRMGEIDNQKVTSTPRMTIPQYEFTPKKRMGALDGGASGDLVFALRNNR